MTFGAQHLFYDTNPGLVLRDTFGGTGPMGTVEEGGVPWVELRGGWTRQSGHVESDMGKGDSPILIADARTPNVTITLSGNLGTGGTAIYFRVKDVDNWFRVRTRYDVYTSTVRVVEHYWTTECPLHFDYGNNPPHTHTRGYWSESRPIYPHGEFTHDHGNGSHIHAGPIPTVKAGTRTVSQGTQRRYRRNVYLEKSLKGVTRVIGDVAELPRGVLSVSANGSAITVDLDGSQRIAVSDQDFLTMTRHGVGYGPSEDGTPYLPNFNLEPAIDETDLR